MEVSHFLHGKLEGMRCSMCVRGQFSTADIVLIATLPFGLITIASVSRLPIFMKFLQNLGIERLWIVRTKYGKRDTWSLYLLKDQGMCAAVCARTLVHSTSMDGIIITRAIGIEVAWKLNSTVAI